MDPHELERQPHPRRRGQRRRQLEPELGQPVLDLAHGLSLPRRRARRYGDLRGDNDPVATSVSPFDQLDATTVGRGVAREEDPVYLAPDTVLGSPASGGSNSVLPEHPVLGEQPDEALGVGFLPAAHVTPAERLRRFERT